MRKSLNALKFGLSMMLCIPIFAAAHDAGVENTEANERLSDIIVKIELTKIDGARIEAAKSLFMASEHANPSTFSDADINKMISLLDDPHDAVRYWVAATLGRIGPRARAAIPIFLEKLPAADCLSGPVTSAHAIRWSLENMGVEPPQEKTQKECPGRLSR